MISENTKKRIITSFFLIFLIFTMIKSNFILTYLLLVISIISFIEFSKISKRIFRNKTFLIMSNFFFIIYLFLFCLYFFVLSTHLYLKIILYILIFGCVASDIGGFIIGKLIKGPKLTRISPNKTYSGAIGALIFSFLFMSISFFLLFDKYNLTILVFTILTSISCQIGDLFFSFLKRKAKIKNTGEILPGHGGILDRIDGMLLAIPTGLISLIILS